LHNTWTSFSGVCSASCLLINGFLLLVKINLNSAYPKLNSVPKRYGSGKTKARDVITETTEIAKAY